MLMGKGEASSGGGLRNTNAAEGIFEANFTFDLSLNAA